MDCCAHYSGKFNTRGLCRRKIIQALKSQPQPIDVGEVLIKPVQNWHTYRTRLESPEMVALIPRVSGVIDHIAFNEGDEVSQLEMKKIITSTALGMNMVAGFANNVTAVENQFGGYWRTRMFVQDQFDQDGSFFRIHNRTRLYYTAKFSEDFNFVNKFEYNSTWGDDEGKQSCHLLKLKVLSLDLCV